VGVTKIKKQSDKHPGGLNNHQAFGSSKLGMAGRVQKEGAVFQ
jgi:hypothetical protein